MKLIKNRIQQVIKHIKTMFYNKMLAVSLKKKQPDKIDVFLDNIKKSNSFDENLKYIQKMLNFDDFTRASDFYKRLLDIKECEYEKYIEDEIISFSENKSNKAIRDYLNAIRGLLLNHIINNIDKEKNNKFSEIREFLNTKIIRL